MMKAKLNLMSEDRGAAADAHRHLDDDFGRVAEAD